MAIFNFGTVSWHQDFKNNITVAKPRSDQWLFIYKNKYKVMFEIPESNYLANTTDVGQDVIELDYCEYPAMEANTQLLTTLIKGYDVIIDNDWMKITTTNAHVYNRDGSKYNDKIAEEGSLSAMFVPIIFPIPQVSSKMVKIGFVGKQFRKST